jgi:hypothetical protein
MSQRWLVLLFAWLILQPAAHADGKAAKRKKPAAGFWKALVKPGAKWVLRDTIAEDKAKASTITVETYDVRKVAGADVARLRWTLRSGSHTEDIGAPEMGRYTELAVTKAGLYLLSADMDDAKVAEALARKPSRSDPPKAYAGSKRNQGRFLVIMDETLVCMGEGPLPGDGECADTCEGQVCISSTAGVVELSGTWAPGVTIFAQRD